MVPEHIEWGSLMTIDTVTKERIHSLKNRVAIFRLKAMVENSMEERYQIAADILDEVERELSKLDEL